MWAFLALCVAAAALVGVACAECGACLDGYCYRKHRLPSTGTYTFTWDIDRNRNILYSYDGKTFNQCQLDTGRCVNTTDIWNIFFMTVDQRTGDIYARIDDPDKYDLYKLDLANHQKELLVRRGGSYLTFKDKLYYSAPDKGIYTFEDGQSRLVPGTEGYYATYFFVDKNDDVYFKTNTDVDYYMTRQSKGVVDPAVRWNEAYSITADRNGDAVFTHWQSRIISRVRGDQLVVVGGINDLVPDKESNWPLFDRDNNMIYLNLNDEYFHLKRDGDVQCKYSYNISQHTAVITEIVNTTPYNVETTTSSTLGVL